MPRGLTFSTKLRKELLLFGAFARADLCPMPGLLADLLAFGGCPSECTLASALPAFAAESSLTSQPPWVAALLIANWLSCACWPLAGSALSAR